MTVRELLAGLIVVCLATAAVEAAPQPGDRGVVLTALEGVEIREIPVRFIGTYDNLAGPGHDVFLVRLEGPVAERVGVANGMSGSPVYIEGELIGALAYRMGSLPREAVAGVTPIGDLLGVADPAAAATTVAADAVGMPISTPVHTGAMAASLRSWLAPQLEERGFVLVRGGTLGASVDDDWTAEPGAPIGVELVRGDQSIAATGTVTWVDGDRIYAFGHPFLGTGPVELPMVTAEVIHTLADLAGSVKLANTGRSIGTVVEDRLSGIVGIRGREARMIPVELRVDGGAYQDEPYRFEVARNRNLSPLLAGLVAANSLMSVDGYNPDSTILASGRVRLDRAADLPLDLAFAGGPGADPAIAIAGSLAQTLGALWFNELAEVDITGVELDLRVRPEVVRYGLRGLHYERGPLRPGQLLEVECLLGRFRGPTRRERIELTVPERVDGSRELFLAVGPPDKIDTALGHPIARRLASARSVDSVVRALGEMRSAHRLTAVLYERTPGVVAGGVALDDLPPTAERLLATGVASGAASRTRVGLLARTEIELDGPLEDGLMVRLKVDPGLEEKP